MWLDCDGNQYEEEYIFNKIKESINDKENMYDIVVGCDSNQVKVLYRFITSIIIYKQGKGGFYFYSSSYEPRTVYAGKNHKQRIFNEVAKSLEVADKVLENTGIRPVIHIDVSPKENKFYTSSFCDNLKGYVISSGYDYRIKPDSYAATTISDRHSK